MSPSGTPAIPQRTSIGLGLDMYSALRTPQTSPSTGQLAGGNTFTRCRNRNLRFHPSRGGPLHVDTGTCPLIAWQWILLQLTASWLLDSDVVLTKGFGGCAGVATWSTQKSAGRSRSRILLRCEEMFCFVGICIIRCCGGDAVSNGSIFLQFLSFASQSFRCRPPRKH